MQKVVFVILTFYFLACNNNRQQEAAQAPDSTVIHPDTLQKTSASNAYARPPATDTVAIIKPQAAPIKSPSGIYRVLLPYTDSLSFEQIVKFNKDNTYQLQETFRPGKKDSVVLTEGTWAPSNGFIWLYKEQVVAGRYKWKGEELRYFDPRHDKTYGASKLNDITASQVWKDKKQEGLQLYGVGNEPFWSVAFDNKDTVSFLLSEWSKPLKMKISEVKTASDTTIYLAQNDSSQLKLMVLPYFCNDGMSDFVYQNKVQVQYKDQTYSGCGVVYK